MNNTAIADFVKAQSEMGSAKKSAQNPHFKKMYADLSSVQEACFPALHKHNFAIMQPLGTDENGEYVETQFIHVSGHVFSTKLYLKIGKADMQGYGSAQTYARRYGLMALAGIAPEDDDGNEAAKTPQPKNPPKRDQNAEFEAEVQSAIRGIQAEPDLESLKMGFQHLDKTNRAVAADKRVIAAKDAKKAELTPAPQPDNSDLNGDQIPYQGEPR